MTPAELLIFGEGLARTEELADLRFARLGSWFYGAQGMRITVEQLMGRPLRFLKEAAPAVPQYPASELARALGEIS